MGNTPKPLLPDSGLPIDEEVQRNLDALYDTEAFIRDFRQLIESKWDTQGESEEFREVFCRNLKEVFPQLVGPHLKKRIESRREKANEDMGKTSRDR